MALLESQRHRLEVQRRFWGATSAKVKDSPADAHGSPESGLPGFSGSMLVSGKATPLRKTEPVLRGFTFQYLKGLCFQIIVTYYVQNYFIQNGSNHEPPPQDGISSDLTYLPHLTYLSTPTTPAQVQSSRSLVFRVTGDQEAIVDIWLCAFGPVPPGDQRASRFWLGFRVR